MTEVIGLLEGMPVTSSLGNFIMVTSSSRFWWLRQGNEIIKILLEILTVFLENYFRKE